MSDARRNVRLYSRIKDRKSPLKGSRPSVPHGTNFYYYYYYYYNKNVKRSLVQPHETRLYAHKAYDNLRYLTINYYTWSHWGVSLLLLRMAPSRWTQLGGRVPKPLNSSLTPVQSYIMRQNSECNFFQLRKIPNDSHFETQCTLIR